MSYVPLNVHTHYSLLLGLSKPEEIAHRCKDLGISSCAITDLCSVSGVIDFLKVMKNNNIKPIVGCKFIVKDYNSSYITLLAKNMSGWKSLLKLVSISSNPENFDVKPKICLEHLKSIDTNDLICITGYYGSTLWNSGTDSNELVHDYSEKFNNHLDELDSVFRHLFVEINLFDSSVKSIGLALREICKDKSIPITAGIESYYANKEDSVDQRILLCSNAKTTLPEITKKILSNIETGFNRFFNHDHYYILDNDLMTELYTQEELDNTHKVSELCENFSPLSKPVLPTFDFPAEFGSDAEYLRHLCRQGWKEKITNNIPKEQHNIYADRIKKELEILQGANLSSYFLIVSDILSFIRSKGWLPGPGRGSAAGCLVSYLIGITSIDPIKYNLLFERFYNAGRNSKDRISMPDIDVDVPIMYRDEVIKYIKDKYGWSRVSQMITFNTLKGRGALKEVLRVYDNLSFEEMNNITKNIPDEAKIADELQEIKDEDGFASIIMWTLENSGDKLKEWCYINEEKELAGPLAKRFEQAIRMEGTKYNQSKHAAGIAIAAADLDTICPMIYDQKTNQTIAGLEMSGLESLGIIKFDILGIALLDKIMSVNSYI